MTESAPRVENRMEIIAEQRMAIIIMMLDKDEKAIKLTAEKNLLKEGTEARLYTKLKELVARANSAMEAFKQGRDLNAFSEEIAAIKKELEIKNVTDTENLVSKEEGRMMLERFEKLERDKENYKKVTDDLDAQSRRVRLKRAA